MSDIKKTHRARFYVDLAPYWQDVIGGQGGMAYNIWADTSPPKNAPIEGWRRFSFEVDLPVFGGSALAEHLGDAVKPNDSTQ